MRASVRADSTTRVITLEVSGVPDVDATKSWHDNPRAFRAFRPDHVTITLVDGEVHEVKSSGPFVRKSGEVSDRMREDQTWQSDHRWGLGRKLAEAPEWVHTLVREAPEGVTDWGQEVPA